MHDLRPKKQYMNNPRPYPILLTARERVRIPAPTIHLSRTNNTNCTIREKKCTGNDRCLVGIFLLKEGSVY